MDKTTDRPLPTTHPPSLLPEVFCDYFSEKAAKMRAVLDIDQSPTGTFDDEGCFFFYHAQDAQPLSSFFPLIVNKIISLINATPTKSCHVDPILTKLLELSLSILAPAITRMISLCLSFFSFTQSLKHATKTLPLKKRGLDLNSLVNYRPVSKLPFISQLVERAVN